MASGVTDKGKAWILEAAFRKQINGGAISSDVLYVALITDSTTPNANHDTWNDLNGAEIASGNSYDAGGAAIARGTGDFDAISDDATAESNNYGHVQLKNIEWTADGGSIPNSGDGARYAILMDNAGGAADNTANKVLAWWDLGSDRSVADGQKLSLQDMEIRLS